ncbi:hydrophobic/amphiphilic exporter-1, HAE1 family [Thermotomaculum hydrothermale]|uniref:Hydrophobic/amphiphilic exporter-1, HAE1 family n=1 Tax=Thermotomaculum hydrothermale TaxID=981385 RepID=A0A7R6SYF9_9BACT|nr:efflux RND transporter permease subunit [Thermotomaculum hydrothermale]BBB32605.1 hydrophobic/amphiphilic exporter-1, HAE1 family [Thermotomaculum hydrothermale]
MEETKRNAFVDFIFKNPHLVMVLSLLAFVMGVYSSYTLKTDLFPEVQRPTVAVLVMEPGASARDMAQYVARPIERECNALSGVRRVQSISKDELAVVTVEFHYSKKLQEAATDVVIALQKVQSKLPKDILPPQIFKVGDFTNPVMTLAITPKEGSGYDLALTRQLAENELKDAILQIQEVSDAEVFGGQIREVSIQVDPAKLAQLRIPFSAVIKAIKANNLDIPEGFILNKKSQVVIKTKGELENINQIKDIPVSYKGTTVHLRDFATIKNTVKDRFSAFHFNGKPAISINIVRHEDGNTMDTIKAVKKALPALRKKFPQVNINIADSQERIINLTVSNLKESLKEAIIFTVLVIFLMISDLRSALITGISIPFTYFLTFAIMWLFHMQFNMVTLTAVILAVGMLVDDAIVVVENIERHYREKGGDLKKVAREATYEIMLAVFSGTFSSVVVLIPIMFLGGYVQKVLRPLTVTLSIALISSYVVSITIIPLIAPFIIKKHDKDEYKIILWLNKFAHFFEVNFVDRLKVFFLATFEFVHQFKWIFIPIIVIALLLSGRAMKKVVGRDLMPPMDTGIIKIRVETESDFSIEQTEKVLSNIEKKIAKLPGLISELGFIGSEPGLITYGKGRTPQQIDITVNIVDRFQRKKNIWQIEDELRKEIRRMKGVKYADVFEFGATPLSSIASTIDVEIAGDNLERLDKLAEEVGKNLISMPGFKSVSRNWKLDREEYHLFFNRDKLATYGLTPIDVSMQIATAVRGVPASVFRIFNQDGIGIRFRYLDTKRDNVQKIMTMNILTPKGFYIPLKEVAKVEKVYVPTVITRDKLRYTADVYGYRATAPVTFLYEQRNKAVGKVKFPAGYHVTEEGEMSQMNESFGRLAKALILSVLFLYLTFVVTFKSFSDPIVLMIAIPFAFIGAVWGLLIAGKHGCMPAFMGFILLAGVVVKNSILLIDFIKIYREQGHPFLESVKMAIKVRTRPILMTAVTTIVGMIPIALEWAVGLERLSPLAIVAIGGLTVGTFLTLVFIPTFYTIKERIRYSISGKKLDE